MKRRPTMRADPDTPGHLKTPMLREQVIPETPESIKIANIADERLPGPDGVAGTGMTGREAVAGAREWWDKTGRYMAPDEHLRRSDRIIASPILNGMVFADLDRRSALRVVKMWYAHIGIQTVIAGRQNE